MLNTQSIALLLSKDHQKPKNASIKPSPSQQTLSTVASSVQDKETNLLSEFSKTIPSQGKVMVVIGGGTAALTYLYTQDIPSEYTHIIILGDRGYWGKAAHRLAQPHHIFALPNTPSHEFVDPAEHDERAGVLPHDPRSAYVHSRDYQARLIQLEKDTIQVLQQKGKKVFIASNARVKNIEKSGSNRFGIELQNGVAVFADKVVVATGAGPERTLPENLQNSMILSAAKKVMTPSEVEDRILTYTDILTPVAEKARNKDVLIYGAGATAAWAMEVAALTAKPLAWVGRHGFQLAISAGPRVNAIIKQTQPFQVHATVDEISFVTGNNNEKKLLVKVSGPAGKKEFLVDYIFNCIGQEPYEKGGLPEIISSKIKSDIIPLIDKNNVTGSKDSTMLGWTNKEGNFIIIGAAQGTYYDRAQPLQRPQSISSFLPRSGQVPITIGGVISSVYALTNYMPISQDPKTGKTKLLSLNVHVMNATQLAVYFTAKYPNASAAEINKAVTSLIVERSQTDFGLSDKQLAVFLDTHFGHLSVKNPPHDFSPETIRAFKNSQLHGFFNKKPAAAARDDFNTVVEALADADADDDNVNLPLVRPPADAASGNDAPVAPVTVAAY